VIVAPPYLGEAALLVAAVAIGAAFLIGTVDLVLSIGLVNGRPAAISDSIYATIAGSSLTSSGPLPPIL